mgnify:FL=1
MNKTILPPKLWKKPVDLDLERMTHPWYRALVRLENTISVETMLFYHKAGLVTMHLPVTTGSISSPMGQGSDSLPVQIDLFGVPTYLADSMQFMLEYGCRLHSKGCYYLMPSFRGEAADSRHLCQFYHSEAEIPGDLEAVITLVEQYLRHLCTVLLRDRHTDIQACAGTTEHLTDFLSRKAIPRVTMDQAVAFLSLQPSETHLYQVDPKYGFRTITPTGEQHLIRHYKGFVWLTHFDHLSVPFYQAFDQHPSKAKNADLLFGIGEVVGAGQRHVTHEDVRYALSLHKVSGDSYRWYTRMKELAPMQTSGFGMGIERFLLWVLNHDDIRDCQLLPRYNGVECLP